MRIWVKPDRLATLGLTVPDLARAIQQQSTVNPSGQVGAEPGAGRPGDDLHGPRAGPAADRRRSSATIVVRSNPDGSVVRLQRRRAHRARRAELPADRPRQRPARRRRRASSRRPARTRSRSPTASARSMDELQRALPGGPRLRATRSTRRCRSPRASRRSSRRSSRRWCWSSSSSSCSCRTGARR